MRDTATDETTGWIRNGNRFDLVEPYLAGFAGVRQVRIPAAGRRYVEESMGDPEARRILEEILAGSTPNDRLADQAEADIAEALHPTGRVIVFKGIVREILPRLRAVEAALANAVPGRGTWDSKTTSEIVAASDDPRRDLEEHLFEVAERTMAAGDEPGGISGAVLGALGLSKKWRKRIRKAAPYVLAAAVVAAPFVLPAIASVASTVGGAVVSGVSSLFGGSKAPAPPQTTTPIDFEGAFAPGPAQYGDGSTAKPPSDKPGTQGPAIDFNAIAGAAVSIWKLKQAGQTTQASQSETQLLQYLMAQGMSQSQASALVAQAMMQTRQEMTPQMPSITVSTSAPGQAPAVPDTGPAPVQAGMAEGIPWGTVALVGAGVVVASQFLGGGKRR